MSPSHNSNQPYKSRVLNFMNRQSLRIGDRVKVSLRQLKIATIWGIQLLAYPFYWLIHSSTLVGKQLEQKATNVVLPPNDVTTSSVGSQPITVLLNSIEPWLTETSYQLLPPPKTRPSLWEKLPFFRTHQPKDSSQAESTSNGQTSETVVSQAPSLPSSVSDQADLESSQTANYVIQGIATHLQTGKLVLTTCNNQAIDLFSETQHEQLKQRIKVVLESYEQIQQPWWWRINWQAQRKRFNPLYWVSQFMIQLQTSALAKRLNWFGESQLHLPSAHADISQQPPPHIRKLPSLNWGFLSMAPFVQRFQQWRDRVSSQFFPKNDSQQADPYRIGVLIQAGLQYFLGHKQNVGIKDQPSSVENDEPWLTKSDLFNSEQIFPKFQTASEGSDDFAQQVEEQLTDFDTSEEQVDSVSQTSASQEVLQTQATPLGYEKHFLTKLLNWFDQALAWLEELLAKLWQWVKNQLL